MARSPKTTRIPEPPRKSPRELPAWSVPPWRRHRIPLLILWAITLLAYANSFRDGLVFDSRIVTTQDTRIQKVTSENVHLILTQDYWYKESSSSLYRPLTTFSYLFNYAVLGNGASPAGYHWVNFALHAVNVSLVYLLAWLILTEFWPAFALAALWAVHPVLTEAVTNIVGRADLLATFAVLGGLLCYARSLTVHGRSAGLWLAALALCVAVGVFSKENAVTVIGVIFLYDIAWTRHARLRSRFLGYVAAGLPVVAYLLVRRSVMAHLPAAKFALTDNPLVGADFLTSRLTALRVLATYMGKLIWPAHLSSDYSYNQIPVQADWQSWLALLLCAALAMAALYSLRRAKPVFFFLSLFFVTIAPTANIFLLIGTIMAERLLYLPSVGFLGALVWAGWTALARYRSSRPALPMAAAVSLALIGVVFGARTYARNLDWYSGITLFESDVRSSPNSYKTHQLLANSLAASGQGASQRARDEAAKSIAIVAPLPDDQQATLAYLVAGQCDLAQGDALGVNGGEAWYRKAVEVLQAGARVDAAVARDFAEQNRLEGKRIGPTGWPPLYLDLGKAYRHVGQYQQALDALSLGQQIDPKREFFDAISITYQEMNDPGKAAASLLEGVLMELPDQQRMAAAVVRLYRERAPSSCAVEGDSLNLNCPMVREHLCVAAQWATTLYQQRWQQAQASAMRQNAVQSLGCPAGLFH